MLPVCSICKTFLRVCLIWTNVIFSSLAVCDIGSASFKYDMRRLSEILAFPRAWYRRSIARRLFLGDQTINLPGDQLTTHTTGGNHYSLWCAIISCHISQTFSNKHRCFFFFAMIVCVCWRMFGQIQHIQSLFGLPCFLTDIFPDSSYKVCVCVCACFHSNTSSHQ